MIDSPDRAEAEVYPSESPDRFEMSSEDLEQCDPDAQESPEKAPDALEDPDDGADAPESPEEDPDALDGPDDWADAPPSGDEQEGNSEDSDGWGEYSAADQLQRTIDSIGDSSYFAEESADEDGSEEKEGFWDGFKSLFDDTETTASGVADVLLGRADAFEDERKE